MRNLNYFIKTTVISVIILGGAREGRPSFFANTVLADEPPPTLSTEQIQKADEAVFTEFKLLKEHSPIAEQCLNCHKQQALALEQSVHGKSNLLGSMPKGTLCLTCHEINHIVTDPRNVEAYKTKTIKKLSNDETCIRCHSNTIIASIYKFPPHVPSVFEQSMHHRKSALGDRTAPTCSNCHGTHVILRKKDPNSPLNSLPQRAKICAQCHVGANINFAATFDHTPITLLNKPIEYFVVLTYRLLTLATFIALGFFMLLDLMTMLRGRVFSRVKHHKPKNKKFVMRMDRSQRVQHFVMLASMIILFLTAWPLLSPTSPAAQSFTKLLGGAKSLAWIHRISGLVMMGDFIYHFVYLYQQFKTGKRAFPMMPKWKDIQDMIDIGLYFLGIRAEKPKFEQFAFHEKFEYWAVCFGTVMMGTSGLILMFPILISRLLPGRAISLATVIHSSEALLAAVVLMIWHFYNVHLKPGIFPMNWSWITGRMSTDLYEEEHGEHVEQLRNQGKWEEDD